MIEHALLVPGEGAVFTFGEIAQLQGSNGHPHQPQHFDAHGFHHATNLPVPALIENKFEPAVFLSGAQTAGVLRAQ
jgi:hypothetical protein